MAIGRTTRQKIASVLRRMYNSPAKIVYHRLPERLKRLVRWLRDLAIGETIPLEKIPHVYPVLKCNLDCPYCSDGLSYDKSSMGYETLSPEEWAKVLNKVDVDAVIFTGGEPTIYRYLPELINELKQNDIRIYSNLVFSVERFLDRLQKPVTFFTSFHPNNPAVTFESNVSAIKALLAHPMCKGVSSHHIIRDSSNGSDADIREWQRAFKQAGVELLAYSNQFEVNANSPRACDHRETRTVKCTLDRVIIGPDGRRHMCVSKMVRRKPEGIIPLDTQVPHMICDEYGMCAPCDEVAVIEEIATATKALSP